MNKSSRQDLPGVFVWESIVSDMNIGTSKSLYNKLALETLLGKSMELVEDEFLNLKQGALLGLCYQVKHPQAILVNVLYGELFCVAVDVRRTSPFLGKWSSFLLSANKSNRMWIPEGYAHGLLSLTEKTLLCCKYSSYRVSDLQRCIIPDDVNIGIEWPLIPYEYPIAIGHTRNYSIKECDTMRDADLLEMEYE